MTDRYKTLDDRNKFVICATKHQSVVYTNAVNIQNVIII